MKTKLSRKFAVVCILLCTAAGIFYWLDHDSSVRIGSQCHIPRVVHEKQILADGFESGELEPFWKPGDSGSGRFEPGAVVHSQDVAFSGRYSVEITVREGDIDQPGDVGVRTERAELDSGKHDFLNRQIRYRFAVRISKHFPIVDNRLVISQIKQKGLRGGPIVAQRFREGRHYITVRKLGSHVKRRLYFELPELEPEVWHLMQYTVRFSHGSDGFVHVLMNGKEVVRYCGQTGDANAKEYFYHKFGLYRDRWPDPMTIYFDDFRMSEVLPKKEKHEDDKMTR